MKRLFSFSLIAASLMLLSFIPSREADKAANKEALEWLDFNAGMKKAAQEKKLVLVDMYTDWCGWCKKMDRDTYANAEIIKKINQHCVAVKFNPEKDATYELDGKTYTPRQLQAILSQNQQLGYPATFIIDNVKKRIQVEAGYLGPQDFTNLLDGVVAASAQ